MSIRVGESWQARDGHRYWVTMPFRDLLAGSIIFILLAAPFWLLWKLALIEAWVTAECLLFLATGILVLAAVARRQARPSDITVARLRWGLVMLDLKAAKTA